VGYLTTLVAMKMEALPKQMKYKELKRQTTNNLGSKGHNYGNS